MVRSANDPNHIALVERWEEKSNQQRYMSRRQETGALGGVLGDFISPSKVTYFEELPEI